jgi:hypothetical protein
MTQVNHPTVDKWGYAIDEQGRRVANELTEREMLIAIVESQRRTEDMVADFIAKMGQNPMLKMMAGKFGG